MSSCHEKDIDSKQRVKVTTHGTLGLLKFLRLKWVFSLRNICFMKRGEG